jgi:hypothetical protein
MSVRSRFLLLAALLLAGAWTHGAPLPYAGPQDATGVTPTYYHSATYALSLAYATAGNLAANVRNTTTGNTCDIPFVAAGTATGVTKNCSSGADNGKTLTVFLNGSAGTYPEVYEEVAGSVNLSNSTVSTQPNVLLNCVNGTLPCLYSIHLSGYLLESGTTVAFTQPFTMATVSNRILPLTADFESIYRIGNSSSSPTSFLSIVASETSDVWLWGHFYENDNIFAVAPDGYWHSAIGYADAASSYELLDGISTAGTLTTDNPDTSGIQSPSWGGPDAELTGYVGQVVVWNNPGLTPTQAQNLCLNDQLHYPLWRPCTQPTGTFVGVGDAASSIAGTATLFISCGQAYNGGYASTGTNLGCNIRRLSDSHTCDFQITTAGAMGNSVNCSSSGDNGESYATWTASTSGVVTEGYDQTGAFHNATQATTGSQIALLTGCINGLVCFAPNGSTWMATTTSTFPQTPEAVAFTAEATGGGAQFDTIVSQYSPGPWEYQLSSTQWTTWDSSGGSINTNASNTAPHVAVMSLAASAAWTFSVDGTENTTTSAAVSSGSHALGIGATSNGGFGYATHIEEIAGWLTAPGSSTRIAIRQNMCTRAGISGC